MVVTHTNRNAFTLIGAFVVVVAGALFLGAVVYVCCKMAKRAATVSRARERNLTNELAEMNMRLPTNETWIVDGDWEVNDSGELEIRVDDLESVKVWEIAESTNLIGEHSWISTGQTLTGTSNAVRGLLLDVARTVGQSCPQSKCGWWRMRE